MGACIRKGVGRGFEANILVYPALSSTISENVAMKLLIHYC